MKSILSKFILAVFWSLFAIESYAVSVAGDFNSIELAEYTKILKDAEHKLTIQDMDGVIEKFEKPESLNFGVYDGVIWLSFSLENPSAEVKNFVLAVGNPLLASIKIFKNGQLLSEAGQRIKYSERDKPHRFPAFDIQLGAQESSKYIVRVETFAPFNVPMVLQKPSVFIDESSKMNIGFAIYFGIILAMIVYNLFLFFSLKDPTYFYYVVFIGSVHIFNVMGNFGFLQPNLWPDSTWYAERHIAVTIPFFVLMGLLFTDRFFNLREKLPKVHFVYKAYILLCLVLIPVPLFYFSSVITVITNVLTAVGILLAFGVAIYQAIKKDPFAIFFLLSWLPVFIGGFLVIAVTVGLVEPTPIVRLLVVFASATEALTLSLALGHRISIIKRDKAAAEKEAALLTSQMEAAGAVQKAFLPAPIDVSNVEIRSKYVSAERTGGDIFGYHHDPIRNQIYLYVGDVMGHGISAALLTGIVAGAVRTSIESLKMSENTSLEQQLLDSAKLINTGLKDYVDRSQKLVTFAMVIINLENGDGAYVNAGHPGIFKITEAGPDYVFASGHALGFADDIKLGSKKFNLEDGEYLFLYTDGLIENTGPNGKILSDRNLMRALKYTDDIDGITERLQGKLSSLWQGQQGDDDYAYVLFKYISAQQKILSA